jgi:hypothetical protein
MALTCSATSAIARWRSPSICGYVPNIAGGTNRTAPLTGLFDAPVPDRVFPFEKLGGWTYPGRVASARTAHAPVGGAHVHIQADGEFERRFRPECEEEDLNLHSFRNQILSPSTHPITVGNSCRDGALPSVGVMERQAPSRTSGRSGGG